MSEPTAKNMGEIIAMVENQFWGGESALILRKLWKNYAESLIDNTELQTQLGTYRKSVHLLASTGVALATAEKQLDVEIEMSRKLCVQLEAVREEVFATNTLSATETLRNIKAAIGEVEK